MQQTDPQQAQQQRIQQYVQKVMADLQSDPDSLTGNERRFGSKYAEVLQRVRQIEGDLTQLREQVRQGEARIRSLELQHQGESGRAGAFLESLVSLKFDTDAPIQMPTPAIEGEGEVKGDNGAQAPAPRVVPPAAQN